MAKLEFSNQRSGFWVIVYDNDDSVCIITSNRIRDLLMKFFPELEDSSPTGWSISKSNQNNSTLWIPKDRIDDNDIEELLVWIKKANKHIWLGLNKNISRYFTGDEMDHCIAVDWNFDFSTKERTMIGNAEYQLKYLYSRGELSEGRAERHRQLLFNEIYELSRLIPIAVTNTLVTTIPAIRSEQSKLSWIIAKNTATRMGAKFLTITLRKSKPKTKELPVDKKIEVWEQVYNDSSWLQISDGIKGRDIVIIDDLYQSGASLWSFAKFLRRNGAKKVIGLVAVKSQRDSDNK